MQLCCTVVVSIHLAGGPVFESPHVFKYKCFNILMNKLYTSAPDAFSLHFSFFFFKYVYTCKFAYSSKATVSRVNWRSSLSKSTQPYTYSLVIRKLDKFLKAQVLAYPKAETCIRCTKTWWLRLVLISRVCVWLVKEQIRFHNYIWCFNMFRSWLLVNRCPMSKFVIMITKTKCLRVEDGTIVQYWASFLCF